MNTEILGHEVLHQMGESATGPIELSGSALDALRLLASAPPDSPLGPVQLPFLG
ncbi:MAG TPA: hypothetical protein VFY22_03600 [Hydrogenophaga sp.]|nr:hypothetical protein [Hydrogenophaga sp.]